MEEGEKQNLTAMEKATSGLSDMKIEDDATSDRKILIAVDFGTTFSGVAWAQTRRVRVSSEELFMRGNEC